MVSKAPYSTPLSVLHSSQDLKFSLHYGGGGGAGVLEGWKRTRRKGGILKFVVIQLSQIPSDSLKGLPIHGNFGTILEAIIISNRIRILGTLFWSFVAAKFSLFPVYLNRHWNFLRSVA